MCEHESFPGFPAIKLLCHNSKIIYGSMKNTVYVGILLKITIGDQKIVTFSYTLRNQFAYQSIHVDEHSVHTIYYVLSTIWATYMGPYCAYIFYYIWTIHLEAFFSDALFEPRKTHLIESYLGVFTQFASNGFNSILHNCFKLPGFILERTKRALLLWGMEGSGSPTTTSGSCQVSWGTWLGVEGCLIMIYTAPILLIIWAFIHGICPSTNWRENWFQTTDQSRLVLCLQLLDVAWIRK